VTAPADVLSPAGRRPVRISYFLRLKLSILSNRYRGSTGRIIGFILSCLIGLVAAGLGFLSFLAVGLVDSSDRDLVLLSVGFLGGLLITLWQAMPLLLFGVDETLDPARFSLLPIPRIRLMIGLLSAAFLGIPAIATLIATSGLVVGAFRYGPLAVLVAAVGVVLGLLTCVLGSRAITSGLASLLRSRRARDLGIVVVMMMVALIGPLEIMAVSTVGNGEIDQMIPVVRVLSWTPLAAPYLAVFDVIEGNAILAVPKLAISAATIVVLWWWWSRGLESAMIGNVSQAATRRGNQASASSLRTLRGPLPATPYGAILARDLRYIWRDPQRRGGVIAMLSACLVVAGTSAFNPGSTGLHTGSLLFTMVYVGMFGGLISMNQFGYDRGAFAGHVLASVPGRTDIHARMTSTTVLMMPVILLTGVVLVWIADDVGRLPDALGMALGVYGTTIGVAAVVSVYGAYALPETSNPFAMSTGSGCSKGLVHIAGAVVGVLMAAPIVGLLLALERYAENYTWLLLPVGLVYGAVVALLGSRIGGRAIDKRGPELLSMVTPSK